MDPDSLREAAVLIPVTRPVGTGEKDASDSREDRGNSALDVERASFPSQVVLTVRSENLRSHAGQISLPGGSREAGDRDPAATALREAEEEIGLPPEQVEVIGRLGPMDLPSGFRVTPVVGLIPPGLEFTPCSREVADIFQAPLALLLDPKAYVRSSYLHAGKTRSTLELPWQNYRIWGATAAILHGLAALCAGADSPATTV